MISNEDFLLEDLMNVYLVENKIRDAYLIQSFSSDTSIIKKRIDIINSVNTNLNLLQYNNYYFLSLKKLSIDDVDDDEKIGKLLRFNCPTKFSDINRDIETITYKIIVKCIHNDIELITYVCQDNSKINEAIKLKDDIKKSLLSEDTFKKIIVDIELKIDVNTPINSVKELLYKRDYKMKPKDIELINDAIFNSFNENNYKKIINYINYDNLIHRGILLSILSEFNYNSLEPFYPLQLCSKHKEINENENKRIDFLVDIIKNTL